jgi:hypothetical protein
MDAIRRARAAAALLKAAPPPADTQELELDPYVGWMLEEMQWMVGSMLKAHPSSPSLQKLATQLAGVRPVEPSGTDVYMAAEFMRACDMCLKDMDAALPEMAGAMREAMKELADRAGDALKAATKKRQAAEASDTTGAAPSTNSAPKSESAGAPVVAAIETKKAGLADAIAILTSLEKTEQVKERAEGLVGLAIKKSVRKGVDDAQGEERYVLGVVLEPEPENGDSQGDTYSEDEVRKAAFTFMEDFRNTGLQHARLVNKSVKILESYIAPQDLDFDGTSVKKGTWLMSVRVLDDEIWNAVRKGDLTGFSIGGHALRTAVDE